MKRICYICVITLVLNVAITATVFGSETARGIAAANEQWEAAFGRADAAAIAALYTQDASLLPPNSDIVSGTENIQALWQGFLDSGASQASLGNIELHEFGDSAVEVGTYAVSDAEGQLMDKGKFIVLWRQVDGQWKLHRDMWNSALPPETAQEEETGTE